MPGSFYFGPDPELEVLRELQQRIGGIEEKLGIAYVLPKSQPPPKPSREDVTLLVFGILAAGIVAASPVLLMIDQIPSRECSSPRARLEQQALCYQVPGNKFTTSGYIEHIRQTEMHRDSVYAGLVHR